MLLNRLVDTSQRVAGTRSRLKKRAYLSQCLRETKPCEVALAVNYLCGTLPQGRIGLGPSMLRSLAAEGAAVRASLTLRQVDDTFESIKNTSGSGSQAARREMLGELFHGATADERRFLVRLILGELRQGALEGVLIEAIADAADLPSPDVRRAVMLAGEPAVVADAVLRDGAKALGRFQLAPLSPIKPMLAQPAENIDGALSTLGQAALEYKMDGARVQIHKLDNEVKIYSRRLNDVTTSLPEIVDTVRLLPARSLILDGEVLALRESGRPHPFQTTMRRFGRKSNVDEIRQSLPLSVFLFDCIHRDGDDLIDQSMAQRYEYLDAGTPPALLMPRLITSETEAAQSFLQDALNQGHEGVMAKSLASAYAAGNRGADWLKVKQAHTLDLVVLAAEWGSGRRKGWLSNLHLGARNPEDGSFVMLGKTFKGLTDKILEWQTKRLLELEIGREAYVVHVKPELVAEIAVNEIQASSQYPAGLALRFARLKRYRNDKTSGQADTIETVRKLYTMQTGLAPPTL